MSAAELGSRWSALAPYFLGALRIVAAFVFILSGTMKLFGVPIGMPPSGGTAAAFSEVWFAGVLEVFGGGLILVGLFTRPVAFVLSGEMAVAYFQFCQPVSIWPIANMGVAPALYCFVWLYFSAAGPGAWSLDRVRKRATTRKPWESFG
jgi:putative oxidoreductase